MRNAAAPQAGGVDSGPDPSGHSGSHRQVGAATYTSRGMLAAPSVDYFHIASPTRSSLFETGNGDKQNNNFDFLTLLLWFTYRGPHFTSARDHCINRLAE